jgi:hypothetical protein
VAHRCPRFNVYSGLYAFYPMYVPHDDKEQAMPHYVSSHPYDTVPYVTVPYESPMRPLLDPYENPMRLLREPYDTPVRPLCENPMKPL